MNLIKCDFKLDWQYPACTEKQAYYNHSNKYNFENKDFVYIAAPWASIIDYYWNTWNCEDFFNCKHFVSFLSSIKKYDLDKKQSFTVCQHIKWKKLRFLWKKLNIKNVFLSHMSNNIKDDYINFRPWHLMAVNYEIPQRNLELNFKKDKKIFFSFIGAYEKKHYRSDIRPNLEIIFKKNNFKNCIFELNKEWFYEDLVYKKQVCGVDLDKIFYKNNMKKTIRYNHVLSNSIFSLCPEGSGPNTIRLWESMAVGTIPVLFENDWIPPKLPNVNWEDIAVFINKKDTENFFDILKSIKKDKINFMQLSCLNAYQKFRINTCFE